jgi:excisionase family DNA binding protein
MDTNVDVNVSEAPVARRLLSLFFTQAELAVELGITKKTLERWKIDGKGPAVTKVGRRILYSRKAVASWLANCEHDPSQRDRRFRSRAKRRV